MNRRHMTKIMFSPVGNNSLYASYPALYNKLPLCLSQEDPVFTGNEQVFENILKYALFFNQQKRPSTEADSLFCFHLTWTIRKGNVLRSAVASTDSNCSR